MKRVLIIADCVFEALIQDVNPEDFRLLRI